MGKFIVLFRITVTLAAMWFYMTDQSSFEFTIVYLLGIGLITNSNDWSD